MHAELRLRPVRDLGGHMVAGARDSPSPHHHLHCQVRGVLRSRPPRVLPPSTRQLLLLAVDHCALSRTGCSSVLELQHHH